MTTFFLIRHAVNEWVKTGKLAGWTPGVHLNEDGKAQAEALGKRLATSKLAGIYSSPLERTMETAAALAQYHPALSVQIEMGIGEVRYGEWQGKAIKKLAKKKSWMIVQHYPTRMQFPEGETMRGAQARAVDTLERLHLEHPEDTVAVVSHSDVIKMIVAHYLGMHLDMFQRVMISPASLTVLGLNDGRPYIAALNDTSHLIPLKQDKE
ncbi:MAG: MSMEG_4193 family putative phosphomutase [Chloroflexi bacterium]|nr:MSMEG_4193 family putative phosphomutase [Chloroflexota bacterium]